MSRYRSGRLFQQFIGVTSYTEERLVLDVIGNARISGILTVPQLYVTGTAGEITGDLSARNLNIIGISTLGGPLSIGNTYGSNGQFLKSTGNGLEWASFPQVRSASTFTATAGQTDFIFSYNVNYVDVFVNGVKLALSEYTATTGSIVVLNTGCFAGDLVEIISYNATSIGGTGNTGGSGGGAGINTLGRSYFNNILATGIVTAAQFVGPVNGNSTGLSGNPDINVNNINSTGRIVGSASSNVIPFYYDHLGQLPSSSTYHGAFAHVHSTGRAYFAHAGWNELVNREANGVVGTGTESYNVGIVTGLKFYGDGSNLSGVVAAGTGVVVQEEGNNVGTAQTINFVGAAYTASVADGVATIDLGSHYSSISGLATIATNAQGLIGSPNIDVRGVSATGVDVTGIVTSTGLDINGDVNISGIITANAFSGIASQALEVDVTSNNFTDETCYITFVDGASGYQGLESDTGLTFNPAASALTASVFNGQLNGNATTATTATDAQNLVGTPDINVRRVVADSVQVATAVTATAFYGNLVGSIQGGTINAYSATFASDVSIGGTLTYEDVRNVDSVGLITARSGIVIGPSVGIAATITDTGNGTFAGIVSATSFVGDGSQLTGIAAGANVSISDNAPSGPVIGDLWWKSDEGILKVYYTDNDSSQWVDASPGGGGGGSGSGSSTTIISPVAYAVVSANTAGTGTGMSWGAYNTGTYQMVFTFDTAQPDTNYYVHTNREQFATHNIEIISKTTTGFTTKWTNSDGSDLAPSIFKGVLIVYASTPTISVGGSGGGGITNIIEDASPQLGSDLDANNYSIYNAGIVTATHFFGGGLGIGINTAGGNAGYGITTIDFRGAGISTVTTPDAGISTVFIEGGGGANVTTSDAAPTSPQDGDLWWNSSVGALKVYYDDGDSQQWVDAAGTQGALSGSYEYDMYSLSGQTNANAYLNSTIGSGALFGGSWSRPGAPFAKQGNGISESSGVFSFPSIGFYKIKSNLNFETTTNSATQWEAKVNLEYSSDGGANWTKISQWYKQMQGNANDPAVHSENPILDFALNISDIAQEKVRLTITSSGKSVRIMNYNIGGANYTGAPPMSTISFEKVIQS